MNSGRSCRLRACALSGTWPHQHGAYGSAMAASAITTSAMPGIGDALRRWTFDLHGAATEPPLGITLKTRIGAGYRTEAVHVDLHRSAAGWWWCAPNSSDRSGPIRGMGSSN